MSTAVGFYHLTRSPASRALARLLGRTLAGGARAAVLAADDAAAASLDAALWAEPEPDWLPHGAWPADDRRAAISPVWITAVASFTAAPNGARFLFLAGVDGRRHLARHDRVFDLFDGGDEAALAAARLRWRDVRRDGLAATYWREAATGWERAG